MSAIKIKEKIAQSWLQDKQITNQKKPKLGAIPSGGVPFSWSLENSSIIFDLLPGSFSKVSTSQHTILYCYLYQLYSFGTLYLFAYNLFRYSSQFFFVSFKGYSSKLLSMNSFNNSDAAFSKFQGLYKFLNMLSNFSPIFWPPLSSSPKPVNSSSKAFPIPPTPSPSQPPCIYFMNFSYYSFILFIVQASYYSSPYFFYQLVKFSQPSPNWFRRLSISRSSLAYSFFSLLSFLSQLMTQFIYNQSIRQLCQINVSQTQLNCQINQAKFLFFIYYNICLPIKDGDLETMIPASSKALILLMASPLPFCTIAPAWPIRLQGGAVSPAINPVTGLFFLLFFFSQSAAISSASPPIQPIMTIPSVSGSSTNLSKTSIKLVPLKGSPPIPTTVD